MFHLKEQINSNKNSINRIMNNFKIAKDVKVRILINQIIPVIHICCNKINNNKKISL